MWWPKITQLIYSFQGWVWPFESIQDLLVSASSGKRDFAFLKVKNKLLQGVE